MSEWLTTGEMIDRLKVGEVAVNQDGWKVTFGRKGDLLYFHESQEPDEENKFTMSLIFLKKDRWRILPHYVSFEEAMKALMNGKTVWLWLGDEKEAGYYIDKESGKLWAIAGDCTAPVRKIYFSDK
jgi:hypothetical protein